MEASITVNPGLSAIDFYILKTEPSKVLCVRTRLREGGETNLAF
jgi:hypothetical protein